MISRPLVETLVERLVGEQKCKVEESGARKKIHIWGIDSSLGLNGLWRMESAREATLTFLLEGKEEEMTSQHFPPTITLSGAYRDLGHSDSFLPK